MAAIGASGFRGRTAERKVLDQLLTDARGGTSAVLVIRGEPGIGKTALLRYLARQASGFRVAEVLGVEAEMELPFAAVHQLCAPILGGLEALPGPQRDALRVAFGVASGPAPDRFLVGLAVLSLLAAVAEDRPLLCLVDDAQWLDDASDQILTFVARRLLAEPLAIVFGTRRPSPDAPALPELVLGGLEDDDAEALLASVIPGRLDRRVRDRIIADSRGNPLALLELPGRMTAAELAGGFMRAESSDVGERLEEAFAERVSALPDRTQRLLLLAAADPVGDPTLVWRAAKTLDIAPPALAPAREAELIEMDGRVRFRHPLVRSGVYRAASPAARRQAHAALASQSDGERDADRRAWHRALAVEEIDEDVAAELERSAGRAQTRGGFAAAAAFLERSAALTADPARHARRGLAAAQLKYQAGEPAAALALVQNAQAGPLDELGHAQGDVLRAQIAFTANLGSDAPPLLLRAARRLEPLDAVLARDTYLDALMAAQFAGRVMPGMLEQVGEAARASPPAAAARAADRLLDGFALLLTEDQAVAAPALRRAVDAFLDGDPAANGGFRWLWLAQAAAQEVWDHDAWYWLAGLQVELVRQSGALSVLPLAASALIVARIYAGELNEAAAGLDEVALLAEATGSAITPYGPLILSAWRGRDEEFTALADAALAEAERRGEGIGITTCEWLTALLANGLGQYDRALSAARQAVEPPRRFDWPLNVTLAELVEASVRCGRPELGRQALERLETLTLPSGADWGLGLTARCRALVSDGDGAEALYREAVERFGRTLVRGEHARAHLLYGEWLRRQGRRVDAREQLRVAHRMCADMGMDAFAERARRELLATGETARRRVSETRDDLTAQELQIAGLARDGLSNPEIGTRLFLSPRTVEWHLRKVFAKLDIHTRHELPDALAAPVNGA